MKCGDHTPYPTERAALDALKRLRRFHGGKNRRALNVFPCGTHFHIGRSAFKKAPSTSALMRRYAKIAVRIDQYHREAAAILGQIVERDRQAGLIS
jgi:hypothetical protein